MVNANNDVIRKGCEKLGYAWHVIPRNVRGCWNIGYCGMGCPTNAKQSMLVTTIPATLEKGGELLYLARKRAYQMPRLPRLMSVTPEVDRQPIRAVAQQWELENETETTTTRAAANR